LVQPAKVPPLSGRRIGLRRVVNAGTNGNSRAYTLDRSFRARLAAMMLNYD
jgi:hypothetical protein